MSMHEGIRASQHAVRRQRAVHRGAVRALPRRPGERSTREWRALLRRAARRRGRTSRTRRSIAVVRRARASNRKVAGAMVDATTMHKQVLVLQLISKFRTLGMFHADLDPLQAAGEAATSPTSTSRPTASPTPTSTPSSTSARSRPGPARMRLRDLIAALQGHVLPHDRRRVHVHHRTRRPSASSRSASSRSARSPTYSAERAAAHPRAADRRGDARALPAHEVRRPEALLGRRRRHADPDARPPDRSAPARAGVQEIVIGMAHRGRLNVLVNTLGKMPADLFSEFEGKHAQELLGGRRQVPPGLLVRRRHAGRPDAPDARVQPVAPRDRQSGGRGLGARAPAPPRRHARATRCCRC